ncbi:MAG: penicillin-binding transpeptidase domain-containing protein, partial [Thermodesulfobacteriota bacterium]
RTYFGKNVWDLDLPECALIAGLPKRPTAYSPLADKEAATKRRDTVLSQMLAVRDITHKQYEAAVRLPIELARRSDTGGIAPYFVEEVRKELEDALSDQQLYRSGLTVITTLDTKLQPLAEQAVKKGVEALAERVSAAQKPVGSLNGSLLCLDVATGEVRAMVGGTDFKKSFFNRAVMAHRQPGSSFKPIVYGCAIEKGLTESSRLLDAPVSYPGGKPGSTWAPQNYTEEFEGEISLRRALAISQNIPAVRLANQVRISSVVQFAHRLGIESNLPPYLSLALGSSELTLWELTSAYSVFPNGGVWISPHMIREVKDKADRVIFRPTVERRVVMSEEGAAIMVDMLRAVVTEGTARSASNVPGPIAGKTGTTSDYKDAWFLGFSPDLAVGAWVGNDNATAMPKGETGGRAALPLFADFMTSVFKEQSPGHWRVPAGMVRVRVSAVSGRALAENEPGGVYALYRKGTEPRLPGAAAAPNSEEGKVPPAPGAGVGD